MKSNNSVTIWTELTETQAETINGGAVNFNNSFFSKLTDQINTAIVVNSGNAIGNFNRAGVTVNQINRA
jgi:hypothetical protein